MLALYSADVFATQGRRGLVPLGRGTWWLPRCCACEMTASTRGASAMHPKLATHQAAFVQSCACAGASMPLENAAKHQAQLLKAIRTAPRHMAVSVGW
jgi:hypothetical protein